MMNDRCIAENGLVPLDENELIQDWGEKEPIISVICVTFNHKDYIKDALNGFLAQRCSYPFEVIIRDDASDDGTSEIIQDYVEKYPRIIRAIIEEENQYSKGVMPLSAALPKAKGKLIALCEGDDYWTDPGKLQKQAHIMLANDNYSLTYHAANIVDETTGELSQIICEGRDYSSEELLRTPTDIMTATKMFKNPFYYGVDEKYIIYGDYPLNVMLAMMGDVKFVWDVAPTIYRKHAGGVWSSLSEKDKQVRSMFSASKILAYTLDRNHLEYSKIRAEKLVILLFEIMPKVVLTGLWLSVKQKIKRILNGLLSRVF